MTENPDLPRHIRAREHTASMIAHFIVGAREGEDRPISPPTRQIRNPDGPLTYLQHSDPLVQHVYERIYADYSDQNLIDEYWTWYTARSGTNAFFDGVIQQLMEDFASNSESSFAAPSAERIRDPERDVALAQLPRTTLGQGMIHADRDPACSICLGAVEIGNEVLQLRCEHWFHPDCILTWLRGSQVCPLCRGPVDFYPN